jgi:2-polyprenyl-6-methoxyphenol hydroxylase-like FAD-dependent oxidoreductase
VEVLMATDYDIITVGGGLGGSALAKVMAERGYKVLVVEREKQFKDRVRGEYMAPWGVGETQELGIYDLLMAHGGYHPVIFDGRFMQAPLGDRDLSKTTPQGVHGLTMYHPELQEILLGAAEDAGAHVRRGVKITGITLGAEPSVTMTNGNGEETVSARLVVGADGRQSMVRKWTGFEAKYETLGLQLSGVLLEGVKGVEDRSLMVLNPFAGRIAFLFPQSGGRARAYFGNHVDEGFRPQGGKDVPRFIEECIKTGAPAEYYETAEAIGPLATFPGIYDWVPHPYKDGVALVGDAATTSDQTWGQGLSLTLGAVRRLRDALLANSDWEKAGHEYADAVDKMWEPIRIVEHWFTRLFMEQTPEANADRSRALPLIGSDPERVHDALNSGPDFAPVDEAARRRFFGED